MIAEGTGTNDKMFYTLAPGAIGGIISRDNNGTKYWYHYDRLGNVMAVTDSNGNIHAGYTMDAWGNLLEVGTSTGYYAGQADPQPYHLTTKEYDPDSALYYFNARWYDPTTARFVSREPLRINGPNLYHFCLNSPVNKIDPSGMQWMTPELAQCRADRDRDGLPDVNDPHPEDARLPIYDPATGFYNPSYPGVAPQVPYPPLRYTAPGTGHSVLGLRVAAFTPGYDDAILGVGALSLGLIAARTAGTLSTACLSCSVILAPISIIWDTPDIWLPPWLDFE